MSPSYNQYCEPKLFIDYIYRWQLIFHYRYENMKIITSLEEPTYEFHVARKIRAKYDLDETFFSVTGHVIFANFYQVRLFVQKLNNKRNISEHVSPGEINGAGLLDEIYHIAIKNYIKNIFPNAIPSALSNTEQSLGVSV